MRYLVIIVSGLMFLALIGSAGAAGATDLGGCVDSTAVAQSGSAGGTDCDSGQNKAHRCAHDAGCGDQLVAISEVRDFSTSAPPAAAVGSAVKQLTSLGRDILLDPPRA